MHLQLDREEQIFGQEGLSVKFWDRKGYQSWRADVL